MNKKVLASALVLATVFLGGCAEGDGISESKLSTESSTSSLTQSSDNSTASSETSDNKQTGMSEELSKYIDGLSNGDLVFVDYTFTENPAAITDKSALGDAYDKALSALKATDDYKNFSGSFTKNSPQARFSRPVEDFFTSGSAEAVFRSAYTDDFDRDGTEESFVLLTIAKDNGSEFWGERDYLVFVGDGGAEILADYYNADFTAALDYGKCGQVIVDSEGWAGADRQSNIWGVSSGKAAMLYGGRLSYEKTDCFLYSWGPQNIGDFAVFDINNNEYLAIQGKELSAAEISAMDSGRIFGDVNRAVMIGGKYFAVDGYCFSYEDGKFVITDKKLRGSDTPGITGDALKTLSDVDYDAALASMITPEQARQ